VDLDYSLVTFNKAVADEILKHGGVIAKPGMCPRDLLSAERAQLWLPPLFQRALEQGPFRAEYTLQDGRVMELAFNAIQAGETIIGVSVFAKDTTERRRAEELLKASEKRFRTLLDVAPVAIGISRNGLILNVNFKYAEMFGLMSRDEAIGRVVLMQWAPESRASIEQLLRRQVDESHGIAFDGVAERPDGSHFPMHGETTAVTLPDRPAHFVFLSDVSKSKAAEEALRESEARFRNYFELPLVGFSIVQPRTPGIIAIERLREMLGYTSEELKGLSWQQITHPDDLESNSANFNRLVSGEIRRYSMEKRYIRKDGSILWADHPWMRAQAGRYGRSCLRVLAGHGQTQNGRKALQTKIRELQLLSEMNGALVTAENEPALLKEYCRIMVETGGYRLAWVGFAENVSGKPVIPVAHFGHEEGYLKIADISWEDGERGHGVTGTAIRTKTIQLAEDFATCEALAPWRDEALKRGYRSAIALPFRHSDGSMASLTACGAKPGAWPESERKLLEEIARDLGYGITPCEPVPPGIAIRKICAPVSNRPSR
jgi:PAS domain S-box-containing protein